LRTIKSGRFRPSGVAHARGSLFVGPADYASSSTMVM